MQDYLRDLYLELDQTQHNNKYKVGLHIEISSNEIVDQLANEETTHHKPTNNKWH